MYESSFSLRGRGGSRAVRDLARGPVVQHVKRGAGEPMSRSDDPSVRARAESVYQSFVDAEPGTEDALLDSLLEELSSEERALALQMIDDYQDGDQPPGSTTDIEPLREGRILGDFQLEVELGRGGWGMVWQARQLSLGRKVALKILYPHHALSGRALRRFQREAAAAGRAVHTSIVSIHETGSCDGLHYICEDLVPGGTTLSDHLAEIRGRPSLPSDYYSRIATIFRELAEGLSAAHDAGVIHRDIKPSNILLTRGGQPLIADFGMAKLMSDASVSGDLTGTPYYMSPEQLTPRNVPVDGRTDVFGLGATLYEALTLRRAFDGDTWQQIAEKILSTEPPAPQLVKSRIPRDLAVICSKAIEKAPKDRYASMADMAEDLRRFLANEPIVARPPSVSYQLRLFARRHRALVAGATLALIAKPVMRRLLLSETLGPSSRAFAVAYQLALSEHGAELEAMTGLRTTFLVTEQPDSPLASDQLDEQILKELVDDFDQPFYVCGPPAMTEQIGEALANLGADTESVNLDDQV